jgi:hypothetical protein
VDLRSVDLSRLQHVKEDSGDSGILIGNFKFGLELANGLNKRVERRRGGTMAPGRVVEATNSRSTWRLVQNKNPSLSSPLNRARGVIKRRSGKTRIDQDVRVGKDGATWRRRHRCLRAGKSSLGRTTAPPKWAVNRLGGGFFSWLLREGLQYNRITLAIRPESRMWGRPHQLRRNQNLARVIDLDNHHELPTVNDSSIVGRSTLYGAFR